MSARLPHALACAIIVIAALARSGQAAAQSCNFVATSSTSLLLPANGSISASFQGQTACSATTTGTAIPFTATLDTDELPSINAGPNPGQSGTVACLTGGCQLNPPITFNLTTQNQLDFAASTNLLLNGGISGLDVNYGNLTSGAYTVRASVQCPISFVLQGCTGLQTASGWRSELDAAVRPPLSGRRACGASAGARMMRAMPHPHAPNHHAGATP